MGLGALLTTMLNAYIRVFDIISIMPIASLMHLEIYLLIFKSQRSLNITPICDLEMRSRSLLVYLVKGLHEAL